MKAIAAGDRVRVRHNIGRSGRVGKVTEVSANHGHEMAKVQIEATEGDPSDTFDRWFLTSLIGCD